jgi:hypothetical protein
VWTVFKDCSLSFDLKQYFSGDSLTFSATGLPSWLSLDSSTGLVTGVCPVSETRQNITGIGVSVSNPYGNASYSGFIIDIKSIGGDQFYFTSASSSSGTVGQAFSYQSATNVSSGVTYSISGAPSWLSCTSAGYVSGAVPEGVTGFSYQITASHSELGSISMTVQCTALTSTGTGFAQHVIVDNFNDFGSTGWAQGVSSGMGTIAQEISGVKTGINSLISSNKLFSTGLDSLISQTSLLNSNTSAINNNLTGFRTDYNSRSSELLSAINAASGKLDGLSSLGDLGNKVDKLNNDMNTNSAVTNNKLDKLNNDMNTNLLDIGFVLNSVDEKMTTINDEQVKQTSLLTDIKNLLGDDTSPDMSWDTNKQIHSNISFSNNFTFISNTFRARGSSPFILTLPFSQVPFLGVDDYIINFSHSPYCDWVSLFRNLQLGGVFLFGIFGVWHLVRTLEY